MAKIVNIQDNVVSIGTNDGGIKEVRSSDINFVPNIGDEVEIFENGSKIVVSKIEKKNANGGINVNVQNTSPQYIANGQKAVSKVVYCLLAFFLGGVGGHKFYAGKAGTGVVFILFCWTGIPLIIAFIELIVGLTKKADSNGMILV